METCPTCGETLLLEDRSDGPDSTDLVARCPNPECPVDLVDLGEGEDPRPV